MEVKKVDHSKMMHGTSGDKLNVAVVNEEDPVSYTHLDVYKRQKR